MTAVDPTHVQAELAQLLREIDLRTFAVTATMGAAGQVGSVGMVTQKLVAATGQQQALGRMQGVLLASSQLTEEDRRRYNSDGPLPVLTADSFAAAVQALADQARPRQAILKAVSSTFDLLTGAVPYETHYQQLPLLLPAEPDRLPREKKEKSEDPWGELRTSDILRWDEETRQEPTGDRPVRLQDLIQRFPQLVTKSRSNVPRFVLLGRPGAGKSTVLGYLRHLCRDTERPLLQQNPRLVPVLVKLPEWQRSAAKYGYSLPEYLARELYRDIAHAPSADLWRQWMARGQVLLLLDGLDETNASDEFRTRGLKPLLEGEAFRACPLVIACRTMSFEEHRWLGRDLPVFTLAPLEWRQQAEFIRKYPEDEHRPFDREALIQEIRRQPLLRSLSTNPQLLNTICYVVGSSGKTELPATRGDLYDRAIIELLKRKDRRPELATGLMVSRKRRLLEEAALKLWLASAERRQLVFTEEEVLSALTEAAGGNQDRAEAVLKDICANSGLLSGQDGGFYSFLHLTLHEFLAACFLARRANAGGLSVEIVMGSGERLSLRELVLQKAYDPAWRELLPLMAGRMKQPQQMLDLFVNKLDEDAFHILLLTGGRCLAECKPDAVDSKTPPYLVRWLTALLYSPVRRHREQVIAVLAALRPYADVSLVLEALHAAAPEARAGAAEVLGYLGDQHSAAELGDALNDVSHTVRGSVAAALAMLGHEESVRPLLRSSQSVSFGYGGALARALVTLADQTPATFHRLLDDDDPYIRAMAAVTLGAVGDHSGSPMLIRLMNDPNTGVVDAAHWALSMLAEPSRTAEQWSYAELEARYILSHRRRVPNSEVQQALCLPPEQLVRDWLGSDLRQAADLPMTPTDRWLSEPQDRDSIPEASRRSPGESFDRLSTPDSDKLADKGLRSLKRLMYFVEALWGDVIVRAYNLDEHEVEEWYSPGVGPMDLLDAFRLDPAVLLEYLIRTIGSEPCLPFEEPVLLVSLARQNASWSTSLMSRLLASWTSALSEQVYCPAQVYEVMCRILDLGDVEWVSAKARYCAPTAWSLALSLLDHTSWAREAEILLMSVCQQLPGFAPAAYRLCHLLVGWPGRETEAIAASERYVSHWPDDPLGWHCLGTALTWAERHDEALSAFRRANLAAANDQDKAWLLKDLGAVLAGMGHLEEAREVLEGADALAPEDPDILLERGKLSLLTGDFEGASELARRVLQERADAPVAHFLLGLASLRLGREHEAEESYRTGLDLVGAQNWSVLANAAKDLEYQLVNGEASPGAQVILSMLQSGRDQLMCQWPMPA